jgi:hypothetical protein
MGMVALRSSCCSDPRSRFKASRLPIDGGNGQQWGRPNGRLVGRVRRICDVPSTPAAVLLFVRR